MHRKMFPAHMTRKMMGNVLLVDAQIGRRSRRRRLDLIPSRFIEYRTLSIWYYTGVVCFLFRSRCCVRAYKNQKSLACLLYNSWWPSCSFHLHVREPLATQFCFLWHHKDRHHLLPSYWRQSQTVERETHAKLRSSRNNFSRD